MDRWMGSRSVVLSHFPYIVALHCIALHWMYCKNQFIFIDIGNQCVLRGRVEMLSTVV